MDRRSFLLRSAIATAAAAVPASMLTAPAHAGPVMDTHPRLLFTDPDEPRRRVASSPRIARWAEGLEASARTVLTQPPVEYDIPDGLRLTHTPVVARVPLLAMAFHLTSEQVFAERLWDELEECTGWADWNPRHFLDTAGLTQAVAIGHDWLHDQWDDSQRTRLVDAIVRLGLEPGRQQYEEERFWTKEAMNWNSVCNAGLAMGALTVAQEEPDLAQDILSRSVDNITWSTQIYAPDGGYPEGPGYWSYGTSHLVLLLASLVSATGDARGREDDPGLDTTGLHPIHLSGPTGLSFNHGDSGTNAPRGSELMWLGRQYEQPVMTQWSAERADTAPVATDVLWYSLDHEDQDPQVDLDASFEKVSVAVTRSAWRDPNAQFLALKGGDNRTSHTNLDLGTFVLDALGVRWAVDLGPESYDVPGYFDTESGQRWQYYRTRTEGQNTVLVDPDSGRSQSLEGTAELRRHEGNPEATVTVVDLAGADDRVEAWTRGWHTFDGRDQVVIQDEIRLVEPADLWWSWHTGDAITVSDDGRTATLSHGVRRLLLRLRTPHDARFAVTPARPLWSAPSPGEADPNTGIQRLVIHLSQVSDATICVQASPLWDGDRAPSPHRVIPIDRWKVPVSGPRLTGLSVDGEPVADFDPAVFSHTVTDLAPDAMPVVRANAGDGATLTISDPDSLPGVARIRLTSPDGRSSTYRVVLEPTEDLQPGVPVVASADDGNLPQNVLDQNPATRWSAEGEAWLRLDLGEVARLEKVRIAWYQGDQRRSRFDIEVSDGGPWRPVLTDQESSGTSNDLEEFAFAGVDARYLRYVGHGNSASDWNSVSEIQVPDRWVVGPVHLSSVTASLPTQAQVGDTIMVEPRLIDNHGDPVDPDVVRLWSSDSSVIAVDDDTFDVQGPGVARIAVMAGQSHHWAWDAVQTKVPDPREPELLCEADTTVRGGEFSGENYGDSDTVTVKGGDDQDYVREGYLRFPSVRAGSRVAKATLVFTARVTEDGDDGVLGLHTADTDWDEMTVTWDDRPGLGRLLGEQPLTVDNREYAVDVTDHVAAMTAAGAPIGFGLAQVHRGADRVLLVRTKEGQPAPVLRVMLED